MNPTPPDLNAQPEPNPYEPPQAGQPPRAGSSPLRQVGSALGFGMAFFGVLIACLIAFVATCVPLGLANADSQGFGLAIIGGLVVAALTGFALTRIILKGRQR